MENTNNKILIIDEGSEFKIKVEEISEFNKSFFKDIYDSAAKNIKDIIENTEKYHRINKKENFYKDKEERNNIIAFAGERGTGKSSAIVSVAEALKDINNKDVKDCEMSKEFIGIQGYSYINLDVIDPALLEEKESIFEIVIAKMFSKFKEKLDKDDSLEFDDKKRLLKKFQNVYKNLKIINTDRKEFFKDSAGSEDILQTLINLASGSNMRDSFIELVDEFLKLFSNEKEDSRFLVISIDDLDMNIEHSAKMAEQIRKYLMIPNVIILMAVKIDQLKDSVEQMCRKNYKVMLKEGNLSDNPKEMAERYIEKLIPNGRKLFLPDIRAHKNGRVDEIYLEFTKTDNKENETKENKTTIEEKVLEMTYRKTGLIFIKHKYDVHFLIPDNLRELQNYLIMLNNMEDIMTSEDKEKLRLDNNSDEKIKIQKYIIEKRTKNIEKFETYFMKSWIKRNLSKENESLVQEIYDMSIDKKNKFVVTKMSSLIFKMLKKELEEKRYQGIFNDNGKLDKVDNNIIFNIDNNPRNISIGDVLEVLRIYDDYDDVEMKKFKFAIKTIYSIMIYKEIWCNDNFNNVETIIGGNVFRGTRKIVAGKELGFMEDGSKLKLTKYAECSIGEYRNLKHMLGVKANMLRADNLKETFDRIKYHNDEDLELLEWLFYFIYLGKEMYDGSYRISEEEYWYKRSNITRGNIKVDYGIFDCTAFISYLLNPILNLERIYSVNFNQNNKITKEVKTSQSMFTKVVEWKEKYKVVIPLYSIELIEYIYNNIESKSKRRNNIETYYDVFKDIIQAFKKILEEIVQKNIFLNNIEEDGVVNAYVNCPVIKPILEDDNIEDFKKVINLWAEMNNNEKDIKDKIDKINEIINYFKGNKDRTEKTLKDKVEEIYKEKIKDDQKLKEDINVWEKFISNYTYTIDGKRGNRIHEVYIDKLLEILENRKRELEKHNINKNEPGSDS
ncbi:hypothetical protein [Oceanirhabdus seepicola]|uniref:Uncharacterized protein n=1 Tax=Oceanirhabdus seepicola TaxID=2828781 RepID=A0A9J6P5R1_9CLOT|nr:hypothetical protein [Oceanirhabdus seepicola]MCM1991173.1 hypothetical protein [Oceanirhabdus seepicola]